VLRVATERHASRIFLQSHYFLGGRSLFFSVHRMPIIRIEHLELLNSSTKRIQFRILGMAWIYQILFTILLTDLLLSIILPGHLSPEILSLLQPTDVASVAARADHAHAGPLSLAISFDSDGRLIIL
jgi:hypothetical protein